MSGKISRSTKLRKYAIAYKSYIRKTDEQKKISKSPRHVRKSTRVPREVVPREVVPREVVPREVVPREVVPREVVPRKVVPREVGKKTIKKPKSKKKSLNAYQKFVQCESKKDKYKDLPGKQRLIYIASEWKKIK
jgi:hypothetical protein